MPTSLFLPDNGRVFWACQAVLFKERQSTTSGGDDDPTSGLLLHGVQTVGVDSSFERTTYADFGRFQKEYGSYGKQIFTISIDRVLDGSVSDIGRGAPFYYPSAEPTLYKNSHILYSSNLGADGFSGSLRNYDITLLYGGDDFRYMGSGDDQFPIVPPFDPPAPENVYERTPPVSDNKDLVAQTTYRCCLLTEINYSIPIDGPVTESLTFITGIVTHNDETTLSSYSALDDYPNGQHVDGAQTISRRHIDLASCVFPLEVQRMFDMGQTKDGKPVLGLQSIEIGASIDYADLFDYGEFGGARGDRAQQNQMKQVTLPVGITASFAGVVRDQYHGNTAWQWELEDQSLDNTAGGDLDIYKWQREIAIYSKTKGEDSTFRYMNWLLGKKNYLTDMSFSGGDTGGGNVEATLSYQNEHSDFITYQSEDSKINNLNTEEIY